MTAYEPNEYVTSLHCEHVFHHVCIKVWLSKVWISMFLFCELVLIYSKNALFFTFKSTCCPQCRINLISNDENDHSVSGSKYFVRRETLIWFIPLFFVFSLLLSLFFCVCLFFVFVFLLIFVVARFFYSRVFRIEKNNYINVIIKLNFRSKFPFQSTNYLSNLIQF